jgi:hypothetical protein
MALKYTKPDGKPVLTYCVANFSRFEEMEQFETEFKAALDELKSK